MLNQIKDYLQEVTSFQSNDSKEIESFRIKFLGKKGILNDLFLKFKEVPADQKKEYGQSINTLKKTIEEKLQLLKENSSTDSITSNGID